MNLNSKDLSLWSALSFLSGWLRYFSHHRVSDEELVNFSRKNLACSKWARGVFAVSGGVHGLAVAVLFYFMFSPTRGVLHVVETEPMEGEVTFLALGWIVGLLLGFLAGYLGFLGGFFLLMALVWPRIQQRDRLLVAYHDQVHGKERRPTPGLR